MRFIGLSLLLLLLMSGVAPAQTWQFVPGRGVGPLTLDMSQKEARRFLKVSQRIGSLFVKYGGNDHVVIRYVAGRAVLISLHRKTLPTINGEVPWTPYKSLSPGTPWTGVKARLGSGFVSRTLKTGRGQPAERYHAYKSLGIAFRTRAGVVVQVDVIPVY